MPKKILLADDSITIQKVVELTFAEGDYEVICASDGAQAIRKIEEAIPDIALVDVMMPQRNGYDVCAHVKKDPNLAWIPVLLLTGTFEPYDPKKAEEVGADGHIIKPFESRALVGEVEDLIARLPRPGSASRAPEPPAEPAAEPVSPEPVPGPATVRIDSRELMDKLPPQGEAIPEPREEAPAGGGEASVPAPSLGPLDLPEGDGPVEPTHPVPSAADAPRAAGPEPAGALEQPAAGPQEGPAADDVARAVRQKVEELARPLLERQADRILKEIAWEVIPDLAERIVRARIRELEEEASSPDQAPLH